MRLPKPLPRRTPTSAPFWDGLDADRVRIQRCDACGVWVHYPRTRCPECLADRLEWHDVSGHGTVLTFTVARQPTARPFADEVPQLLAVVELDEGVRMTTTLVGVDPERSPSACRSCPSSTTAPTGSPCSASAPGPDPPTGADHLSWAKISPWDSSRTEQD